jgi:hypothetical protein
MNEAILMGVYPGLTTAMMDNMIELQRTFVAPPITSKSVARVR